MEAFYERCLQKEVLVEYAGAPGNLRAIIGREGRCSPGRHSTVPGSTAIGVYAPLQPMQHRLESAQRGGFSSRPEETGFPRNGVPGFCGCASRLHTHREPYQSSNTSYRPVSISPETYWSIAAIRSSARRYRFSGSFSRQRFTIA